MENGNDMTVRRGRPFEPHKRDEILIAARQLADVIRIWNVTASSLSQATGIARTTIIYHVGTNDQLRRAIARAGEIAG